MHKFYAIYEGLLHSFRKGSYFILRKGITIKSSKRNISCQFNDASTSKCQISSGVELRINILVVVGSTPAGGKIVLFAKNSVVSKAV